MSARLPVETLIETVVEKGLCTRCGTCVGACPSGALRIAEPLGACLPEAGDGCTSCGLCLASCPGASVDFRPLEKRLFGEAASSRLLGVVRGAFLAHAADAKVRAAGSSGAVVTAILLDCMERAEADGALLFAPHETEPWRGWGRVVSTAQGILEAAQSRYHLSPLNTVLAHAGSLKGSYAYVGLPCQVHGLRKLASAGWTPAANIAPVIGVYCGNNLSHGATRAMLRKLGVKRLEDVAALSYRAGKWPGEFFVRTKDGMERSISKLDFNQAIPFYINPRCLFCVDLTNELADISIGDGWAKEGRGDEGWSVVLVRTERGERLFNRAVESLVLHAEAIPVADAELMHSHAFDLKKTGSFLRLGLWRRLGRSVPRYDRPLPTVGVARRLVEVAVSLQFVLASSSAGRALFAIAPAGPLGGFFRLLRRGWMRATAPDRKGQGRR